MAGQDLEARAGTNIPVPQRPQHAYHHLSSSTEQDRRIPLTDLPQMESGLRNRTSAASSPRNAVVNGDAREASELLPGDETQTLGD